MSFLTHSIVIKRNTHRQAHTDWFSRHLALESLEDRTLLTGTMIGLGDLPGGAFYSNAYDVSADGTVVVGVSEGANGNEAFRWTAETGMVGLGDLAGGEFRSVAQGVSADGSVIVGYSDSANGREAFIWTAETGMVGLGDLPGGDFSSEAQAVSADGTVVVGNSDTADTNGSHAFRWTAETGMVDLGEFPGGRNESSASAVSADGTVIVGTSDGQIGNEAFRWTSESGLVGLGDFPGGLFNSAALGVSADGAVVVGRGRLANVDGSSDTEAFRWTVETGLVSIDNQPNTRSSSEARDVSDDGSVIVGRWGAPAGEPDGAFRWTEETGIVVIGKLPGGGDFSIARAVSGDGSVIVGQSESANGDEAFIWIADSTNTVSINNISQPEGDADSSDFEFAVTRTGDTSTQLMVDWTTANGTAIAGEDYTADSGTLVFDPGITSLPITISVNGDSTPENDENFFVNLTAVTGDATIGNGQGTGTIENDDAPPGPAAITVTDNSGADGDAQLRFSTPLSQYRSGAVDSFYVRPGFADGAHYIDITNSGEAPLTLFEIQINAPDVTTDVTLTSSSADDIVLAPGATQRVNLNFTPTLPTNANHQGHDFLMPAGLVILSNAANAPSMQISLQGTSTFASDLTYDGSVNFGDLGVFNVNFGLDSQSPGWDPTADITGDGAMNFNDLGVFNVEFGLELQGQPTEGTASAFASSATTTNGDYPWQAPQNAVGDTPGSMTSVVVDRNEVSDPLRLTKFGFNIPVGATIAGIEVTLLTTGSDEPDGGHGVSLSKDGTIAAGSTNVVSGSWSTGTVTIGGPSELWGTTWTAAELNTANFGLIIQIESGSNGDTFQLFSAQVEVTYTSGGGFHAGLQTSELSQQFNASPTLQTESVSTSLLADDEQALAEEIARRMYFAPQKSDEPAVINNTLNEFDAVYEELGGGGDESDDLDWLFDLDAEFLADAMLHA